MSHIWMRHVTHMDESCHHVTQRNVYQHTTKGALTAIDLAIKADTDTDTDTATVTATAIATATAGPDRDRDRD